MTVNDADSLLFEDSSHFQTRDEKKGGLDNLIQENIRCDPIFPLIQRLSEDLAGKYFGKFLF
jgi:hypothetical protein